ncbi:MAG: mechanosensitive ion channel domain-containing protein, partial [Candidatus Micrarchaeota archaeon]
VLFSVLGRSRLFFIPRTLKELFLTMAFIIALVSAELVSLLVDRTLIADELFKIWQVLLVFAISNVFVRVVLTGLDFQYRKSKDRSGLYRSIGLMKGTIGIVLYLIALLIAIYILSTELGLAVMATGFFIIMLIFAAGYDQVKSIVAGLQLGDYYVDVGNLVTIDENTGFVEAIHGRSTMIRTLDKRLIIIPNHQFFKSEFMVDAEDVSDLRIRVELAAKDPLKAKERISAIASKISIAQPDIPKEYKPKVFQKGIGGGKHVFMIMTKVTPASDVWRMMDSLSAELSSEFKGAISELRLEDDKG